jgi:hypothetical protein
MAERAKENGNSAQAEGEQVQLKTNFFGEPSFNQPNSTVQARLKMGSVGDKYEKEADSVADRVVSNNDAKSVNKAPAPPVQLSRVKPGDLQKKEAAPEEEVQAKEKTEEPVQMKCSSCGEDAVQTKLGSKPEEPVQMKCAACGKADEEKSVQKQAETEEPVQMKCSSCGEESVQAKLSSKTEEPVQMKCTSCGEESVQKKEGSETPTNDVESTLASSKGGGSKMDETTQSTMESGIGADFSGVNIHTDSNAVQMNQDLGARAFTNGSDVYFNKGEYNPSSKDGQHLLAHELTHTVQQGAASETVQKKSEGSEEEMVQEKSELTIQKEEKKDICAEPTKADEAKAKAEEQKEIKGRHKSCKPAPIKKSDYEEGEDSGKKEDVKDIEAKPEAPVGERQKNAPPADGITEKKEEPKEEEQLNPFEFCDKRKERKTLASKGKKAAVAGAAKGADGAKKKKEDKGKKGETPDMAKQLAVGGVKPNLKAPHLGEEASPKLLEKRKELRADSNLQRSMAKGAIGNISAASQQQVAFENTDSSDDTQVNAMATAFLQRNASKSHAVVNDALSSADLMKKEADRKKRRLLSSIAKKKLKSAQFYKKEQIKAKLQSAVTSFMIQTRHTLSMMQINGTAMTDSLLLRLDHEGKRQGIEDQYKSQLESLKIEYKKAYGQHVKRGIEKGEEARSIAYKKAEDYRFARVDGATDYDRQQVGNGTWWSAKVDDFWPGKLTYNKYAARADAARETGDQYKEGMIDQGKEAANKLLCKLQDDLSVAKELRKKGLENLQCALDDGLESISLVQKKSTLQSTFALEKYMTNIEATKTATIARLNEKDKSQQLLLNDYGTRQAMAIDIVAARATGAIYAGIYNVASDLNSNLTDYIESVSTTEAPDVIELQESELIMQAEFDSANSKASIGIKSGITQAQGGINDVSSKSNGIVDKLYREGIKDAKGLSKEFSLVIQAMNTSSIEFYSIFLTTNLQVLQKEFENGLAHMGLLAKVVEDLYAESLDFLKKRFEEGLQMMTDGMDKTIGPGGKMDLTICSQAEKAADDVRPWWISALKILLVIIVIVVITIATAGVGTFAAGVGLWAASAAFALGASAAVAGTLGVVAMFLTFAVVGAVAGAISSFVIHVGFNIINDAYDGDMTVESVFKGSFDAAISGAIGGFIGGLGGPLLAQIFGKFQAGFTAINALRVTIDIAFDFVGAVLGDAYINGLDNLDWAGILRSVVMSQGVKVGSYAKNKWSNRNVDAEVKPTKTKTETDADTARNYPYGPAGNRGAGNEAYGAPTGGQKYTGGGKAGNGSKTTTPVKNSGPTKSSGPLKNKSGSTKSSANSTRTQPHGPRTKPSNWNKLSKGQKQAWEKGYKYKKSEMPEGHHWRGGKNGEPTLVKVKPKDWGKLSGGQKQAWEDGIPFRKGDMPEGHHWRYGKNGEPTLVKNSSHKGTKMKWDAKSRKFIPVKGGAQRAAQFSKNWPSSSLKSAINKFAPGAKGYPTDTGKILYTNSETGIQVVYDKAGKYFRIQNTKLSGRRNYLDLDGNIPNNKVVNGKTSGRNQSEYNQVTHYNNTD